jgi:signal transduction histidine kinase
MPYAEWTMRACVWVVPFWVAPGEDGTMARNASEGIKRHRSGILTFFELGITVPTLTVIAVDVARHHGDVLARRWVEVLAWIALIAIVELMPVPMWRGTHIGVGFPLLMVVAFIYPAPVAAGTAFLAAFDPREFRGEIGVFRALFNRSQVALAVWGASLIFHAITPEPIESTVAPILLLGASLAAVVDFAVNVALVSVAASILYWMNPVRVARELRIGRPSEFVISYLGLAIFGVVIARVFSIDGVGFYAVPAFVIPLLLARQMFFRSKALEEAHAELQDREQVLRALSNRMAEERQDERQQIAAYLHDDLAQLLFRLSIQVDVARRHLSSGKIDETEGMLAEIKETKNRTSDRIRALIRDLHRSPLGRAGLAEALQGFIAEAGRESDVRFHTDVDEVELPAPIALLLYHIAREGVMNALKHAEARNLWVSVKPDGDEVTMVLRDDGVGYDTSAPEPEGHFGLTMMRERATVGGGSYTVASTPGEGTTITVRFPTSWLQEATDRDARESVPAGDRDGAAPGIPARSSSTAGSVPA